MNSGKIDHTNLNSLDNPQLSSGHHYSKGEVAAIASAYTLAVTPINILPLIVGAIIASFAIGETTAGALTTIELLAMSATAFLLAPWAPKLVGRRLTLIAVCIAATAHGLTALTDSPTNYLPTRIVAGMAAGLLLLV